MDKIKFRDDKDIPFPEILSLYTNAGWSAYTAKPDILKKAIDNSLYLLTAWHGEQLAGLLRAVGDGLTIIYIQDILVLDSFRRQGIGSELLKLTLEKYQNVRQVLLLTDEQPGTVSFYEKAGLQRTADLQLVSFIRIKK